MYANIVSNEFPITSLFSGLLIKVDLKVNSDSVLLHEFQICYKKDSLKSYIVF